MALWEGRAEICCRNNLAVEAILPGGIIVKVVQQSVIFFLESFSDVAKVVRDRQFLQQTAAFPGVQLFTAIQKPAEKHSKNQNQKRISLEYLTAECSSQVI